MASSKKKDESIKTYLRIKPVPLNEESFLTNISQKAVIVKGQQSFAYDRVFDESSTNDDIFKQIGQPLVTHSLESYNCCVLAYGQTSSGKTFTMKGFQGNEGLIPRTMFHLFRIVEEKKLAFQIRISYLEIYNQNIIDLLTMNESNLDIREDPRKNITIIGLTQQKVSNVQGAMKLFEEGESRRKFACNNLNASSSRSHTIFRINIEVVDDNFQKKSSCINMVDLAGSQGVSRTKAQGNVKKQGENINKSILALSNVIRCMSEKQSYINFRDSKLTRILQSSFCNNSRSVVICNINPIPQNYQQTINTLKFGMYASQVKLDAKKNIAGGTTSKYFESQAKNMMSSDGLLPRQRIQFEENKRIISSLREENQQLREHKKQLNNKLQFLELENHKLLQKIQNMEEREKIRLIKELREPQIQNQQREQYQKMISTLKADMQSMVCKYEVLNQHSSKVERSERYLTERVAQYQNEIRTLKQSVIGQTEVQRAKTPIKPKLIQRFKIENNQQVCPLTIGSIMALKAQIIKLKQDLYSQNQQIAELIQSRNEVLGELESLRDQNQNKNQFQRNRDIGEGHKRQIKDLHVRVNKLRREIQQGKNRQIKLARLLKACSLQWIHNFDQFNQWYSQKKKRLESIKKKNQIEDAFYQNIKLN